MIDPRTSEIRYVGQTIVRPKDRFKKHLCDSQRLSTHVNCWIKGILQAGLKPVMQIICEAEIKNLDPFETFFIILYKNSGCDLTNLQIGGQAGKIISEKTKQKMSVSKLKNWSDPAYKNRQIRKIRAGINNDFDRIKAIFSESAKRVFSEPDVIAKRIEGIRLTLGSDEQKRKKSGITKAVWNNMALKQKEERINKLHSNNRARLIKLNEARGNPVYKEHLSAGMRKFREREFNVFSKTTNEFIGTWKNQIQCAKDLLVCVTNISACLRGIAKTAKGYTFKYKY